MKKKQYLNESLRTTNFPINFYPNPDTEEKKDTTKCTKRNRKKKKKIERDKEI